MKVENLKIGELYIDKDRVNTVFYEGRFGYLYYFVTAEYDDEKQDFIRTNDKRRLTEREVKNLIEY